jgi:hypothetical protein
LGDAGRSYVVGYGNNPPTHPHHRSRYVSLTTLYLLVPSASGIPNTLSLRSFHQNFLSFLNPKINLVYSSNLTFLHFIARTVVKSRL